MAPNRANVVLADGIKMPLYTILSGKRVILASQSPRRQEIFRQFGLSPEVVPSTFGETLSHLDYAEDPRQYAVATATEKMGSHEVYERLVLADPDDPPDLVIAADTICILDDAILEKPGSKPANLVMLMDLNGRAHDVVTGITIVTPSVVHPGYSVRSLCETTRVHFADHSAPLLEAYVDTGEGVDRAGGYAIQQKGGVLVQRIEGDYNNVVGFPGYAFVRWLSGLLEDEELFDDEI